MDRKGFPYLTVTDAHFTIHNHTQEKTKTVRSPQKLHYDKNGAPVVQDHHLQVDPNTLLSVSALCPLHGKIIWGKMQTTRESEIPKLWLPMLSCPVSTHYNSLLGSVFTYCTLLSCRITAAFAAFLSFCPKWSRNPSESKWINQKATIRSGLYKDEEYYELMLLLLNMHEFLISRAKNRDVHHQISPGCTIFIHLHPAKKQAIGKRILAVHFYCALNSAPNKKKLKKKKSLWGPGIKDSEDLHPLPRSLTESAANCADFYDLFTHPPPGTHLSAAQSPSPVCVRSHSKEDSCIR